MTFTTTAGVRVSSATAASQHEDWNIRADRQDKPGYIASGMTHSVLTARMQCSVSSSTSSKHVIVAVTYLKSYAGVGAVHVYGKEHIHSKAAGAGDAAAAHALNLRGSDRRRQLLEASSDADSSSSGHSSSHVIDALDTTQHASPYQTKHLKLDHTFFLQGDSSTVAAGTQLLEIHFELLSALDVPLIQSIKAAAIRIDRSSANSDDSDYSDADDESDAPQVEAEKDEEGTTLFLRNLSFDTTAEGLKEL